MVYVLSKDGKPLMPTKRHGKVRRMLKDGNAVIVRHAPFTIQLVYATGDYTQDVTLGIDAGYMHVGISAVTQRKELFAAELNLLSKMSERIKEKAMYRKQRRLRLRYRKPRFDNRHIPEGWLAPSIHHKLDSHIRMIDTVKAILPVKKTIIEVAAFDIQKIRNPEITGSEYQQGEQSGFWNLREYILHRDDHKCQNPKCKNHSDNIILEIHHIGYWYEDRTDRPGNLITLCDKCHTPPNHQKNGFLYGWKPKVKSFKDATFMTAVRWAMVNNTHAEHTYGYITKSRRIMTGLPKSHINDAFCIAGGSDQTRMLMPFEISQKRRNNRSLQKFYDAKYTDIRTKEKVSASELNSGRRTRNKNLNSEFLKKYRGEKLSKGRVSIRKNHYPLQPGDIVQYDGQKFNVIGVFSYGKWVRINNNRNGIKDVKVSSVTPLKFNRGFVFEYQKNKTQPVQHQLSSGDLSEIPA